MGPIFLGVEGGRMDRYRADRMVKRLTKKAGIDKRSHPARLSRRSYPFAMQSAVWVSCSISTGWTTPTDRLLHRRQAPRCRRGSAAPSTANSNKRARPPEHATSTAAL